MQEQSLAYVLHREQMNDDVGLRSSNCNSDLDEVSGSLSALTDASAIDIASKEEMIGWQVTTRDGNQRI